MLKIKKSYLFDEEKQPIAVQIPIKDFVKIEEILENYGLIKLMSEVENDEVLSQSEAISFYSD